MITRLGASKRPDGHSRSGGKSEKLPGWSFDVFRVFFAERNNIFVSFGSAFKVSMKPTQERIAWIF